MPIQTASGGGENALVGEAAIKYGQQLLADRGSLRGHPAIVNMAQYGAGRLGMGSKTAQYTLWGFDGTDAMSSVSEGSDVSETALTNALRNITWARKALRRDLTDDVRAVDPTGMINPMRLAQDGVGSAMVTLTGMLAALNSGYSTQVGSTGNPCTDALFTAAKKKLIEALVPGPYLAIMDQYHFADWMEDVKAAGGLVQWQAASAAMQILRGPGFQGTYDGIDVFTTDRCPTSGSDRISSIIGRGACGYVEQEVVYGQEAIIELNLGPIAVELDRKTLSGSTSVVTHYRVGVAEIEDARGVGILAAR